MSDLSVLWKFDGTRSEHVRWGAEWGALVAAGVLTAGDQLVVLACHAADWQVLRSKDEDFSSVSPRKTPTSSQ